MQKNNMFKKGLVTVIILLFIGISIIPKTIAYSNTKSLDVNENITTNTKLLPDIIIERVISWGTWTHHNEYYYKFGCIVKNIGFGVVDQHKEIRIDVDVYEARIFSPDNYQGHYDGYDYLDEPMYFGESVRIDFYDTYDRPFFSGLFLRFECQLTCNFEEKNTDNNYFEKTYFPFPFLVAIWLFPLPILF